MDESESGRSERLLRRTTFRVFLVVGPTLLAALGMFLLFIALEFSVWSVDTDAIVVSPPRRQCDDAGCSHVAEVEYLTGDRRRMVDTVRVSDATMPGDVVAVRYGRHDPSNATTDRSVANWIFAPVVGLAMTAAPVLYLLNPGRRYRYFRSVRTGVWQREF